ncbi:MAG: hypothetical protein K1W21_14145 [Oscillospiraceae bacterium]
MNYKSQAENQLRSEHFDKYSLPDITGVSIPASDDKTRMSTFLKATGNPYLFRVGDIGVHVVFSGENGDTLQKRICRLLSKSI